MALPTACIAIIQLTNWHTDTSSVDPTSFLQGSQLYSYGELGIGFGLRQASDFLAALRSLVEQASLGIVACEADSLQAQFYPVKGLGQYIFVRTCLQTV